MSRFFRAGSDSESESESSDDGIQESRPIAQTRAMQFSDDEEETKRVVRSEKDKRFEEILTIIKQLKNHKKIKDFANVLTDFESLTKAFEKARKVVDKEGVPRFYIKTLVELEDFINECWEDKEWRKTISKNNSKGLSTVRQKIKKYNRDFESDIGGYKANPDAGDEEAEEEDDVKVVDDESEEEAPKPVVKKTEEKASKLAKAVADDDDDDDSDWGSDESDESSSSDDEMPAMGKLTAEYFLKSTTEQEAQRREERKREKRLKKEEKEGKRKEEDEDDWQEVNRGPPSQIIMEKPKMFAKDQEITVEAVVKKLNEIIAMRGKKGTDRSVMIDMLRELKQIAEANNLGQPISVKICFNIMAAIYDYNPNIATCMKNEMWENSCLPTIIELLNVLVENSDIIVGENISEESEQLDKAPFRIRGCILTMVERLDEEFTKMLQACDAHSTEFVERLKDEQALCDIIDKLERYLEKAGNADEMCRIYLRHIEHLYYKFDSSAFDVKHENPEKTSEALMDKMCKFIYAKDSTDRLRTRSMLCHIYHHALHDRWYQARDLMLMSHLQDNIQHSDVSTQILYNRTLVQLGLCGFRQGHIRDAHNALVDIQSSNRAKELLAQGLVPQRQHERSPEQEKIEKRRLLPYHKHINLELLECVYLVSAMLLEIPYMAAHELDVRKRMISKNFHHVLKMSERQTLTGPPESMREHVVAASKAMKNGDWKKCRDFIINEKMNAKVWDLFFQADKVRDMISAKIQEESLRTYLFRYSSMYDSLSLDSLAAMFQIETTLAHATISKMIINEELMASLDEPTQIVVMHRTEPTRLQSLALQLSEKVGSLVDNNERIMEIKQGNFFFNKSTHQVTKPDQRDNFQNPHQHQQQQQQQWGGRGRQNRNNPHQQRAY
ncbi:eukaryotic translation initiation factor 3 subunit C-like isoform X2 [Physella acuta]|uniref:eukaryotic translation initiation factor 3 subunit C-like isoform X2 n=1 Tax=Physella acuta TaxID=109671 RepID=UPI0027DE00C2|nr:eukaryotic translation initiation factor 3 subunit C-like isoform X2 [Physella acuta]